MCALTSAVHLLCVIPARLGSTRLPDKPLRLVSGEPLVRRVVRNALGLDLDATFVVATDDSRVLDAIAGLPVTGVLTDPAHGSGTARVAEVAARPEFAAHDVVLNLQGDEPFVTREAALGAVDRVLAGADIGTAAQPLTPDAWRDPHRVKVDVDARGRALRFYRTPAAPACSRRDAAFQHIGLYACRPSALARWMGLPAAPGEDTERLEQLRPLHHGWHIGVAVLPDPIPHGIDTEDDLRLAEARL